jgi:hypothetical protein
VGCGRKNSGNNFQTSVTELTTYLLLVPASAGIFLPPCSRRLAARRTLDYLSEFDFRYSNPIALGVDDQDRAEKAIMGAVGKRLTYRWPNQEPQTA